MKPSVFTSGRPWLYLLVVFAVAAVVFFLTYTPHSISPSSAARANGESPRERAPANHSAADDAPIAVRTPAAIAVLGETSGATHQASGVHGFASSATGQVFGVMGISAANQGRGIYGIATEAPTSAPTYGVYGESLSNRGVGVYGQAVATDGSTFGGDFLSVSGSGRGLRAIASATGSGFTIGGEFETRSTNGRALFARSSAPTGLTYGLFAHAASPQGFGVWSQGDLGVVGDANVSGLKSSRIDHPRDPENMFLLHYSADGPEPLNVYGGIVTLDDAGAATVQLPDYFGDINRDPRYTLTPIGAPMPNLHVAQKIVNNAFRIAGGQPGMEVSWEVKAVRDDLYVRSYGAPVEVDKGPERGRTQHPELHPQPRLRSR